jgi:hypothetical protein
MMNVMMISLATGTQVNIHMAVASTGEKHKAQLMKDGHILLSTGY